MEVEAEKVAPSIYMPGCGQRVFIRYANRHFVCKFHASRWFYDRHMVSSSVETFQFFKWVVSLVILLS